MCSIYNSHTLIVFRLIVLVYTPTWLLKFKGFDITLEFRFRLYLWKFPLTFLWIAAVFKANSTKTSSTHLTFFELVTNWYPLTSCKIALTSHGACQLLQTLYQVKVHYYFITTAVWTLEILGISDELIDDRFFIS